MGDWFQNIIWDSYKANFKAGFRVLGKKVIPEIWDTKTK
jgi:hypothetical protein